MELTFYNLSSPTNVVNKTLPENPLLTKKNINPNGPINRVDPVFTVEVSSSDAETLANANYLYCGSPFKRYYFIVSIDFTIAKTAVIACHVDVLMSHASIINTTTLNYIRGAGDINEMDDSSYPISDYMVAQTFAVGGWDASFFSNQGNGRQFLLRTISGDSTNVYHDFNLDQVYWRGEYSTDGSGQVAYYDCYTFHPVGVSNFQGVPTQRPDIQGIVFLNNNDYIRYDSKMWRYNSEYNDFTYLGETT